VLGASRLTVESVEQSLGVVLKYREDLDRVREAGLGTLVHE